jgi:Rrf2 family nitric oxide-sensitive transcriptional repressor
MRLTTHTDYALRLLIYLMIHRERKVSTKEIAVAYGISLNHLTKVAKSLTKGGWLIGSKGGGGGLVLASHTPSTRIGEIVRFTETSCDVAECFDAKNNTCPISGVCHLQTVFHRARRAFFEVLDSVSVEEMAANPSELIAAFTMSRRAG